MKLISWNVNGLRAVHKKGFNEFLASEPSDILCLQEIKIQHGQLGEELEPPATHARLCTHAEKKGYSGVATYLDKSLSLKDKKTKHGIGSTLDHEGRFVITEVEDIILYNVYVPSGTTGEERQNAKYEFLDEFLEHLKALPKKERERVVLCGDFNICHKAIDIHHPKTAEKRELSGFLPEERKWLDSFLEAGFVDSFREIHPDAPENYSWWSYRAGARGKNLGWRIDYFFVAAALRSRVKNAGILNSVMGSDHCPIFLDLD